MNNIYKTVIMLFALILSMGVVFADVTTNTTTYTGGFLLDLEKDLNIYMVILLIIIAIAFILFTTKIFIGGILLTIIGLMLMTSGFNWIIALIIMVGGVISLFA